MTYPVPSSEIAISYNGVSYVVTLTSDPTQFRIRSPLDGNFKTVDPATAAHLFGAEQAVSNLSLFYSSPLFQKTAADWVIQLSNDAKMIGVNTFNSIATTVPGLVVAGALTDGVGVLPVAADALYGAVIGVPASEVDLTVTALLVRDALKILQAATAKYDAIRNSLSIDRNTPILYDDIKRAIDLTQIGLFLGESASQNAESIPLVENKSILDVVIGSEVDAAKGIADSVSDVGGLFSAAKTELLGALSVVSSIIDIAGVVFDQVKFTTSLIALGSALNSDTARYAPLTLGGLVNSANALKGQPSTSASSHVSIYSINPSPASFNENSGVVTFTITRTDTSQAATVFVSTVHDQGIDNPNNNFYYNGILNRQINFAPNIATAQVQLSVNDVGLTSGAEAFRLIVQQNSSDPFTTSLASTTFTIVNNDLPPASSYTITPNTPQINENAGAAAFTITRTNTSQAVTVYVSTVHDQNPPQNPNGDYYYKGLLNQPITFAAGVATAQVQLTINDLHLASGSETFRLIVQQHSTDPVATTLASDTFTIVNNDAGIVANASVNEPVNTTFQLQPFLSLPSAPSGLSVSLVNFINTHTGPGLLTSGGSTTSGNVAVGYASIGQVGFSTGSATGSDKIEMFATYSDGTTSNVVDLTVNIQTSATAPPPPQNTSGPVINSNVQPFQVVVGQKGVLSASNLSASDTAYPDPSLITYNITSAPTKGFFYNHGQLAHSFTQADVNAGQVAYQAAVQAGLLSEMIDTFAYVVSDPSFRQTPVTTALFKIEPLPPPPQTSQPYIDINFFPTVSEGGQIFVTGNRSTVQDLHVTDPNPNFPSFYTQTSKDSSIIYTIVQGPSHGKLEWFTSFPTLWFGGPSFFGQPVTQFTQNDLNNGWFVYINDFTSGAADGFSFTVSDGFGGSIGLTTATIPIEPVNPLVLRINAGAFVTSGGQSIIPVHWLQATDAATTDNFTFTVKNGPLHGALLLSGLSASTFTQLDIDRGLLTYRQNGGTAQSDQITLSVTDAFGNSIPDLVIPVKIGANALDRNTGALVGIGQSIFIGGKSIHVMDPGMGSGNPYADTPPYLIYTLSSLPTHGALSANGTALHLSDQFTQDQLDQNLLTYAEDGSVATSDSFGFSIADAFVHNNYGSGTFNITIVDNNGGRNFVGSSNADIFYSGPGNNWIVGGSGTIISYAIAPAGVNVNLSTGLATNGFGGTDTVTGVHSVAGSSYDDILIGGAAADVLNGGPGNDSMYGDALGLTAHQASVYRLYEATLGREADVGGLQGWTAALDAGATVQGIAIGFVNSAEFQAKYGNLNNTQFVTLLYNNVLNRAPDTGGLNGWVGGLNSGMTRESVVTGFSESVEYQANTANDAAGYANGALDANYAGQVYRLYLATLNREPDSGGLAGWVGGLESGSSLGDITAGFVNSPEFQAKYGSLDNTQFVTLLYNNVLHRAPETGGLNGWVGKLAGGMTRQDVVNGFSESAELISNTQVALASYMQTAMTQWFDTFDPGSGTNMVIFGLGSDTLQLHASDAANDQVYGLNGWDHLQLFNFGYANTATAMTHMTQIGQDVLFADTSSNFQATFHHTTLDVVTAALTKGSVS